MGNLAPLLLIGGAALVVATARKKKKRVGSSASMDTLSLPDGSASKAVVAPKVVSTWVQRQEALKFLAEHGVCESDPGAMDGKKGPATTAAVKAFQGCVGITADGKWGEVTERKMLELLRKLDREGLPTPKPGPGPTPDTKWSPDDIIVMDPQCNLMLHIDDSLFAAQRKRAAEYALDGNTTYADAESIHQEMVEEHAPLCASLGRNGVGAGVRTWWDTNIKWIYNVLREYEILPNALEEDAEAFGLL